MSRSRAHFSLAASCLSVPAATANRGPLAIDACTAKQQQQQLVLRVKHITLLARSHQMHRGSLVCYICNRQGPTLSAEGYVLRCYHCQ
jgi:hypothetical protein